MVMKVRIIALVVVAGLLITGIAVLLTRGNGEESPAAPELAPRDEREQMTPEERARALLDSMPDGSHQGRLITVDPATITFRLVEVFAGGAADAAAREDGALPEGATLPSGQYVRDSFQTVTLPHAGDPSIRIQVCTPGCAEVETTVDSLVSGAAVPNGGPLNVFTFTITGGDVVSLTEVLLP